MSRSSFRLTVAQSLLLLILLLMSTLPTPSAATSPDKLEALRQLRELIESELERREMRRSGAPTGGDGSAEAPAKRAGGEAATLDDVLAGAKAFGSSVAVGAPLPPPPSPHLKETTTAIPEEAVTTSWTNGTLPYALFSPLWFSHLLASMLTIMPLAAWIAVLCAVVVLLCLLLLLLIYCCCCRRGFRERQGRKRGGELGKEMLFSDIDIVGKKAPPYGEINFSLEYDVSTSQIIITASSCIGLPKDPLKELDPYVVVHVGTAQQKSHTDGRSQQNAGNGERSKVVKNNVNPAFNFTRVEKIKNKRDLKRMVITFEVYDWDIGTRHRMIARRVLKLAKLGEKLDKILGRKREYTRELYAGVNQEATGPGDICVALCYSTQEKHLWVHVIECKGVFLQQSGEPDEETLPNTYVKLALSMAGSSKKTTRSTKLIKSSRNPYFNEQFVFKMESMQMMRFASLRLSLLHRTETLRIKRVIGSQTLSISADKGSLEFLHWDEAMSEANQGRPLARWHSLISPEQERLNAERKAAAERKKELERAEEESAAAQLATALVEQ